MDQMRGKKEILKRDKELEKEVENKNIERTHKLLEEEKMEQK